MIAFMQWLQSFSSPVLDQIVLSVTNLVNETLFVLFVIIVYWCISKEKGLKLVCSMLFSIFINIGLKNIFRIPRPFTYSNVIQKDLITSYGYSFPSGHSQTAASFFTSLWLEFRFRFLLVIGIIMTLLIGFSRIYLGVHTPIDVVCGIFTGILAVLLIQFIVTKILEAQHDGLLYLLTIPGILGILFTDDPNAAKLTSTFLGFLIGFVMDKRFLCFSVTGTFFTQISKCVIGTAVLLAIQFGIKLIGDYFILDMARYFLTGFSISYLCPLLFQKIYQ